MPLLSLKNLSKHFDKTQAVADVSLEVERGEFFGLLGPSGCGKTTTLRMIAGLEKPDAGSIRFDEHRHNQPAGRAPRLWHGLSKLRSLPSPQRI